MLMLIVLSDWMRRNGHLPPLSEQGVLYWSAMYIPIVVAMASTQNVVSAVSGGPVALLAGVGATVLVTGARHRASPARNKPQPRKAR